MRQLISSDEAIIGKDFKKRFDELHELTRAACEVCFTVSWEPIAKHADADGVNTIGPDQLARCGYCWMRRQLEAKLTEAKQQVAFAHEAMHECENQCAKLRLTSDALQAKLTAAHSHLEAQRVETYQAVEREQAAKAKLATAEASEKEAVTYWLHFEKECHELRAKLSEARGLLERLLERLAKYPNIPEHPLVVEARAYLDRTKVKS